jgi:hypothetical protein
VRELFANFLNVFIAEIFLADIFRKLPVRAMLELFRPGPFTDTNFDKSKFDEP